MLNSEQKAKIEAEILRLQKLLDRTRNSEDMANYVKGRIAGLKWAQEFL